MGSSATRTAPSDRPTGAAGLRALFRQHLVSERRASAHTVRAYLNDLDELLAFACQARPGHPARPEPQLQAAALDAGVCRSYLASLFGRNEGICIARKQSSLRTFFRLLVRRRLLAANPLAGLRAPKRAQHLPAFLGKEEAGLLLDSPDPRRRPAQ